MSKRINAIIDTYSRNDRLELLRYLESHTSIESMLGENDGFQLVAITFHGRISGIGVLSAAKLVLNHNYPHFTSVLDYIVACEEIFTKTGATVGFMTEESGDKLREFYLEHTGNDVDFNKIEQYKDGFKLIWFSIPLRNMRTIGITEVQYRIDCHKFSGVEIFINWYNNTYLKLKKLWEQEHKEKPMYQEVK